MALLVCLACLMGTMGLSALAEGEEAPETEEPAPSAQTAAPEQQAGNEAASAALCARVLREGSGSADYESWLRTLPHVPYVHIRQKVGRAILMVALGMSDQTPDNRGLYLVQCKQAPLPGNGVDVYMGQKNFNLHGAVYADEAITSVTVSVRNRAIAGGRQYPKTATVRFDASEDRRALGFDEEINAKGDSLDSLLKLKLPKDGKHSITITATTVNRPEPVTLYEANFTAVKGKPILTSNVFRDNYTTALQFFGGDTSKFLMGYTWKSDGNRDIFTDTAWREAYIVKATMGRVHADAVPYFERASGYLQSAYLRVNVGDREGKVMPLSKLVDKTVTYVPRFQSDLRLISHHTFGTSVDVNDAYGPNKNDPNNQALIYVEVAENLRYNGISTDEQGQTYYDFTYTGSRTDKADGVPKVIVNYLLYELAFFRAGFSWGFYYDHTCDAMHFSLTDGEYYRHMDSEDGLRKVFEYYD